MIMAAPAGEVNLPRYFLPVCHSSLALLYLDKISDNELKLDSLSLLL